MTMRLIDANKLINIVNEMPIVSTEPGWFKAAVLLAIVGAPTIEFAPMGHGRWIKLSEAFESDQKGRWVQLREALEWDRKECSVCGERCYFPGNYCPNCGAKMDGGEDDAGQ